MYSSLTANKNSRKTKRRDYYFALTRTQAEFVSASDAGKYTLYLHSI